jgi:hypothetical protein
VRLVGDIGVRALPWQLRVLDRLIVRSEIDFVHITIPSCYSALLGELLYRRHRFPFGIDYIDPWVHVWPGTEKRFSKAWLSCRLANRLEPWAVKNAALITAVAPGYYQPVLERNPHLSGRCVSAAMPYGSSDSDYAILAKAPRETFLFPKDDGRFHVVYAGAMLPKAYAVLERFLEALAALRDSRSEVMRRLRVHFVGTGNSPNDPNGFNIRPQVCRFGLEHWVSEHPHRIGYVDVLNHLAHASAILILGSTEPHYTPSKLYQAVQARRPAFALLHEQSTAVGVLRETLAGRVVTFTQHRLPDAGGLANALADFVRDPQYSAERVRWATFDACSARNSARVLADAVDRALEVFARRGPAEP